MEHTCENCKFRAHYDRKPDLLLLLMSLLFACCSSGSELRAETANTTRTMNITIGGATQSVTLADNEAHGHW